MPLFPPVTQRLDPYAFYTTQRHDRPVVRDESQPVWGVYRYDDVKRVLSDTAVFSSERFAFRPQAGVRRSLLTTDPPLHRQLRGLVTRAFTPRAVEQMAPRIAAIAHDLLDHVMQQGQMDLVRDFAYPLPVTVIAEMLGVPASDRPLFKQWADQLLSVTSLVVDPSDEYVQRRLRIMEEMDDYFRPVIESRRRTPKDDLIGNLVAAELDGERLSEADVLSFCMLLLLAGHVTTVNLIANAMLSLLEHPEALATLRAQPAGIPKAIEEALRFRSPVQTMTRVTTQDVELSGTRIPKGELVMAFIGSANHDETVFAAPDRFDIAREPNPHLAFGYGIHFCLGAPLARLEGAIAMRALLERLGEIGLGFVPADPIAAMVEEPMEAIESVILHGVTRLPMHFVPARSG